MALSAPLHQHFEAYWWRDPEFKEFVSIKFHNFALSDPSSKFPLLDAIYNVGTFECEMRIAKSLQEHQAFLDKLRTKFGQACADPTRLAHFLQTRASLLSIDELTRNLPREIFSHDTSHLRKLLDLQGKTDRQIPPRDPTDGDTYKIECLSLLTS